MSPKNWHSLYSAAVTRAAIVGVIAPVILAITAPAYASEPHPTWTCDDGYADGGRSFVVFEDQFGERAARWIQHDQLGGDRILSEFLGVKFEITNQTAGRTEQYSWTAPNFRKAFKLTIEAQTATQGKGTLLLFDNNQVVNTELKCRG